MNYYICKDLKSANACNKKCINNGYLKFSIVKKDGFSTISFFKKQKEIDLTGYLKDCQIENIKNWLCQELDFNLKTNSFNGYKIFQMTNGVFSFQSNMFSKSTVDTWTDVFACARIKN